MSTPWLAIQSFQQGQALLTAINTLSLHTKLNRAGIADEGRREAAQKAREELGSFLQNFDRLVHQAEQSGAGPLLGVNPRMRQLVRKFVAARWDGRFRSPLLCPSIARGIELICSTAPEDQSALLECLADLRIVVEEHLHADVTQVLGEI
jgi:hypothetical protein